MKSKPDVFVMCILGCSLALNVYLGVSLRGKRSGPAPAKPLPAGTQLKSLQGTTLDGAPFTLAPGRDSRDLALYIFSTACGWCEKNLNNIRTLASRVSNKYRIVGVSTGPADGLQAYARAKGLNFEIVLGVSKEQQIEYQMSGTPHIMVLSRDAKLKKVLSGALTGALKEDAERFFGLSLPGLDGSELVPQETAVRRGLCVDPWGLPFDEGFKWPVDGLLQKCTSQGWVRSIT